MKIKPSLKPWVREFKIEKGKKRFIKRCSK